MQSGPFKMNLGSQLVHTGERQPKKFACPAMSNAARCRGLKQIKKLRVS